MKFSKIRKVKSPNRANEIDAGIDLLVPEAQKPITLKPQESCVIPAGVKFNVPEGHALVAFNKSGIAVNRKLHVGACVIDCGYQGEVHINLTNVGLIDQYIHPGDKIVQVVLLKLGVNYIAYRILDINPEHRTLMLGIMNGIYIKTVYDNQEIGLNLSFKIGH